MVVARVLSARVLKIRTDDLLGPVDLQRPRVKKVESLPSHPGSLGTVDGPHFVRDSVTDDVCSLSSSPPVRTDKGETDTSLHKHGPYCDNDLIGTGLPGDTEEWRRSLYSHETCQILKNRPGYRGRDLCARTPV